MTERDLATLLHDSATDIAVPTAPAATILGEGRRLRRRRRTGWVTAAAVAVIAAGGTTYAVAGSTPHDQNDLALAPATAPSDSDWAVAQGSTIHLGTGRTATVPGKVKAMYYTSAGTLVRVGATPYTDAPDSNYWLAHDDGSVSDFKLSLGDRVPGTDPTLPYLAYADRAGDNSHWKLVVVDVRSGAKVREIPFQSRFTWGGWVAPPVSLSGDHAYVGVDKRLLDVDWRTGTVQRTSLAIGFPEGGAGRLLLSEVNHHQQQSVTVVDAQTGRRFLTVPVDQDAGDGWPQLSPDGEHLLMTPAAMCQEDGACSYQGKKARIYDVGDGRLASTTALGYGEYGWTATGSLLVVDGGTVKTCDPDTLECTTTRVELNGTGPIWVSGNGNES